MVTEAPVGCCVYCVVPTGVQPSLEGVVGVDPAFGVGLVTHGGLSALASPVRLEEFGAEALKRNLDDLDWLKRAARLHDAVLARVLSADAVVPLRLCTVFTDESGVREMLEREHETLLEAVGRVRGHAEWSVKLLADPRSVEAAARERSPTLAEHVTAEEGKSPGRAFFVRRKLDREVRERARTLVSAAAQEVHARLQQEAAAATVLPPQHPDVSGRSGEMVLNGAYLVHRSRTVGFAAVVEELGERRRAIGLEVELSGPWAPYNFVAVPEAQR